MPSSPSLPEQSHAGEVPLPPLVGPDFLCALGHDLRSPLNSVIGLSEALLESGAPFDAARTTRYLGLVHASGRRLLAQLTDLLELARIESGHLPLDVRLFDLGACCRAALELAQYDLNGKTLHTEFAPGSQSVRVRADERRLHRVLQLLVARAVQVTPVGGTIRLALHRDGDGVTLTLRDEGPPMRCNSLAELLNPSLTAPTQAAVHFGATELGLALADRLAHLQGGSLSLRPQPPPGTTFTLHLPPTILE